MIERTASHTPLSDYHRYRPLSCEVGGREYTVVTKPGMEHRDEVDPATRLLIEVVELDASDEVLSIGCGAGLVGLVAAQRALEGHVALLDWNAVAVEAASRTLALNAVTNAEVQLSDCGSAARGQSFDVVAIQAPREREVAHQCVRDAALVLRPGGACYVAGANRAGIKSTIRYMEQVFGQAYVLAYKGGCRVATAIKSEGTKVDQAATEAYYRFRELTLEVLGEKYTCFSKPGIFSWNRLDEGTRRLVESMEIRPEDRVLDLGCGYGLAGLVAAGMAPRGEVVFVDASCIAVEATRRSLEWNRVVHGRALLSDCGAALLVSDDGSRTSEHQAFDAVITNPPFHQGRGVSNDVAHQFIRDAAVLLRPGGRFYLVANRFLPYGGEMEGLFQEVGFVYRDNRFQVWRAVAA